MIIDFHTHVFPDKLAEKKLTCFQKEQILLLLAAGI